jgi:hypothetical protein
LNKLTTGNFSKNKDEIASLFGNIAGQPTSVDATDGLRITFSNNEVIHLRPQVMHLNFAVTMKPTRKKGPINSIVPASN